MVHKRITVQGFRCSKGEISSMCICVRTTARIRQHAKKEQETQHPKMQRQANLRMLAAYYVALSLSLPVSAKYCAFIIIIIAY